MAARTLPNFLQHMLNRGPMQQAMANRAPRVPALMAMGAKATTATRSREAVALALGWFGLSTSLIPVWALMNRYGINVTATRSRGARISAKNMLAMAARGTSPDILLEGSPRILRLYPVIRVRESLQKAIHDEA